MKMEYLSKPKKRELTREEVEEKLRNRVECETKAQKIVESLIENQVNEEYLIDAANYIHVSQYVDVTEERAIDNFCGYPLCTKTLPKQPKQKYCISTKCNKVYDITERKNFCSNRCYKASKYFENQISTTAVWARESEPPIVFQVIPIQDIENKGSAGNEVSLNPALEIKQELRELDGESSQTASGLKSSDDDLKDSVASDDQLQTSRKETREPSDEVMTVKQESSNSGCRKGYREFDAKIDTKATLKHATSFEKDLEFFNGETEKYGSAYNLAGSSKLLPDEKKVESKLNDPMKSLPHSGVQNSETNSSTTDKGRYLMDLLDKRDKLQNQIKKTDQVKEQASPPDAKKDERLVIQPTKVASFISDQELLLKNVKVKPSKVMDNIRRVASQMSGSKPAKKLPQKNPTISPLEPIKKAMFEWKTHNTVEFFSSSLKLYTGDADKLGFDYKYAALGKFVDSISMEEREEESTVLKRLPDFKQLEQDALQQDVKVREYLKGNLKYPVLATDEEEVEFPFPVSTEKKAKTEDEVREPVLPLIDAHSQMAIRRKIFLEKLNKVLPDLMKPLRVTMADILSDLKCLVHTFNFTATNILFRPADWILLGYVLLYLLSVKIVLLRHAFKEEASENFYKTLRESAGVQYEDVQKLVHFMIAE